MKAGNEKCLIFRCAELLGKFSIIDKISQKRDLTKTEKSKNIKSPWEECKTNAILEITVKAWPLDSEMLIGSAGSDKYRWRRKDMLTAKELRIKLKN